MLKYIFSMKVAVFLIFMFGAIVGGATFIENDYGTQTAKALIYNAQWFEFFLLYFILMLVYNIIKYKSYKNKMSVFIFHIAFLVIAIGASMTRYIGYEGTLPIREGSSANAMISTEKILAFDVRSGDKTEHYEQPILFSSMTTNSLSETLEVDGKEVHLELTNYLPAAKKELQSDPKGKRVLELMVSNSKGKGRAIHLFDGDHYDAGSFMITYNHPSHGDSTKPIFSISEKGGVFEVTHNFPITTLSMLTRETAELSSGSNSFIMKKLYQFGGNSIVLKEIHEKSSLKYVSTSLKTKGGIPEMVTFDVTVGDNTEQVNLFAYSGMRGEPKIVTVNGVDVRLTLGAKIIELPFSLKLIDFELKRYPGSMSPSSYASEVELTDREEGIVSLPYRIYMNHVLDHRNYRFFQSSYDQDEKGTILSVNHDPGTLMTYIGYFLLTLGMIWNLFDRKGRFQKLLKGARKLQSSSLILLSAFLLSFVEPIQAVSLPELDEKSLEMVQAYDKASIEKFAKLTVQDSRGRMKPMDTLAHEIISKLTGKSSVYGVEPASIFLGMVVEPKFYQKLNMIKIGHKKIALDLGLNEDVKYASFNDFFSKAGDYKLSQQISESVRKKPLDKSAYDKELVKADERLNIAYMTYLGSFLKIYPKPNDANNQWGNPQKAIDSFPEKEAGMIRMMTLYFFEGVTDIQAGKGTKRYDQAIGLISLYQKKVGANVVLSDTAVDVEVTYNKLGLLSKLVPLYILVGLVLLIASFINIVKPSFSLERITKVAWVLMIIGFTIHVFSMGMRWYIAGHAPWSNAYESIVFIAGSTIVAGLILARKSPFTLGATALLAGVTMGVAHMNFINPEITTLVPVLKSYWLMIHVATIISGDGFLGLGSILSLIVLLLFIIKKEDDEHINRAIKELTNIAEMSLIIGLFLMTVGNFLGGVWANESWGRYWGWDAKETWAAVTILVYATVLHLRFIPKFNNPFAFNVASLWSYSTVIMTYFGVNYYLSGLHSYAAGERIPLPDWVIPSVIALFVLTLISARSWKNIKIVLLVLSPLLLWVAGLLFMLKY